MSIRDAQAFGNTSLPAPNGANGLAPTQDTDYADATGKQQPEEAGEPGATTSTPSFYDQQIKFLDKENQRREAMDKTIGEGTLGAASPLDSEGGKEVSRAARIAGVPTPSGPLLRKVAKAVKDNPEMEQLNTFIAQGLSGKGENLATPEGASKAMQLAARAGETSGLLTSAQAKLFSQPAQETLSKTTTLGTRQPLGEKSANLGAAGPSGQPSYLSGGNISAIVFLACTLSMDSDNKTKAAELRDMQKCNEVSALISGYISNTLQPAQAELDRKTEGKKDASGARVLVGRWTNVDTDDLFQDQTPEHNFALNHGVEYRRYSSAGLSTLLAEGQQLATTASNNSEKAGNRFTATDTQSNETFTMLVGFLKIYMDSANAILRNVT